MFKKISLFIVIAALAGFVAQSAQAIIVRGEVWRKQCEDGTYKMIYCLSDIHILPTLSLVCNGESSNLANSFHNMEPTLQNLFNGAIKAGKEQKRQLCDVLSHFAKDEIEALVEDPHSAIYGLVSLKTPEIEKILSGNMSLDFLPGIAQDCIKRDISMINFECRLNKVMMSLYLDGGQTLSCLARSTSDCEHESDRAIQEIRSYLTGPFLNIYNEKELIKYGVLRDNFIKQAYVDDYYDVKKAAVRDICLLDIKAINQIHMSNKKHIALAMGAAHIQNIVTVLPGLGYEKVYESGCTNENIRRIKSLAFLDLDKRVETIDTVFSQAQIFDVTKFIGDNQLECPSNSVFNEIEQKSVNVFDPDKLLVSMVRNYPTRFPFCLLLPKVAKYLKEEEQQIKQWKERHGQLEVIEQFAMTIEGATLSKRCG